MEMKKYKLGELMDVTRGQSLSGEYYSKSGNLVRLTLGNFDYHNNCFKDDKSKDNLYFTGSVKKEFILKKDDIITPLTEQAIGLLGSTAKIPCSGKYIQSQDVALIKCNKKLNPDFAFYLIPSKIVRNQLSAAAQQTKIRHTYPDKIKDCSVWVPEYSEQEKIGKLLSRIDNKIAINRQINRNLEELAKQIYDYWFVQFDFPNEEGKPYKSSGGKMVWNDVLKREIPDGWKVQKLTDYLVESTKSKIQVNQVNDSVGNVPFFTSGNAIHYVNDYLVDDLNIFLSTGGNASVQIYFGKASYSTDTWCINFSEYTSYMFIFIQSIIGYINDNLFTGSGLKHLQKDKFGDIKIAIPPENVINAFNKTVVNLFKMKAANMKSSRILNEQMNELLPLLMNGQVSVKE